jgi:membrane protein DedA with SNARE-associated domain
MDAVLEYLEKFKYLAMFGILFLCGLGLPIPEEVTLIGSGLFVGWEKADLWLSSGACVFGILAGDSIIFGMGYLFGHRFLRSRPMRLLLSVRRQRKVAKFFQKHGAKAVFFARFFAGVRIGVYAYAGSQRMSWFRFLILDLLGALISGPTSIWVGAWAARHFARDPQEAAQKAQEILHRTGHFIILGIIALLLLYLLGRYYHQRRSVKARANAAADPAVEESKCSGQKVR